MASNDEYQQRRMFEGGWYNEQMGLAKEAYIKVLEDHYYANRLVKEDLDTLKLNLKKRRK